MTLAAEMSPQDAPAGDGARKRVVYLLGAGATQGAIAHAGSTASLIMRGLIGPLREQTQKTYKAKFDGHHGLAHLVNDVMGDDTDFEQLLTFLADTPAGRYQQFAEELKDIFSSVLRQELEKVRTELGERHWELYGALLDMHAVTASGEQLAGFLTLNYDTFLEKAIERGTGRPIDYGITIGNAHDGTGEPITVLKLHGSFDWRHTWPIAIDTVQDSELWIPPGIRKTKTDYPFNSIWGAARELLDCDVLRIIGCNLGSNDWDLISLLFTTLYGRDTARPYAIEVIDKPHAAERIVADFSYLQAPVRSILEVPELGAQLISELMNAAPVPFGELDDAGKTAAVERASKIPNPFQTWLKLKGEQMLADPALELHEGPFLRFVESF